MDKLNEKKLYKVVKTSSTTIDLLPVKNLVSRLFEEPIQVKKYIVFIKGKVYLFDSYDEIKEFTKKTFSQIDYAFCHPTRYFGVVRTSAN